MFVTDSIETILSESRKYALCLTASIQFLEQLPAQLRAAVLGNIGNLVIFRVGAQDAGILARELAPVFTAENLLELPYYHVYIRMMIDGKPAKPFSAKILEADSGTGSSKASDQAAVRH